MALVLVLLVPAYCHTGLTGMAIYLALSGPTEDQLCRARGPEPHDPAATGPPGAGEVRGMSSPYSTTGKAQDPLMDPWALWGSEGQQCTYKPQKKQYTDGYSTCSQHDSYTSDLDQ